MFSKILKELRLERNLVQKELGKKLGISLSSISMYERGERQPDLETLGKIADYFEVSTDCLLGRTNKNPSNSSKLEEFSKSTLTQNEKRVLKIFRRLMTETYQEKAISQFVGYVDCLVQLEEDNGVDMGKDAQSTPSKKSVG